MSSQIRENIKKIRENKDKRDALTKDVKELKPKRDTINNEISLKLKELDNLKREKTSIAKSLGIVEPPPRIKQAMEKLEFKIETEPMSFEKEQSVMKKIKKLKKLYDESSILEESNKGIHSSVYVIKSMRREANQYHGAIQDKAGQSQTLHEEIIKISAEVDKLKAEEEEAFQKFSEFKKKFNEVNTQLKEKLKDLNDVKSTLDKISSDRKERIKAEQESILKSKEEEVNQKIKRGEKLTTEDLLVFQKFDR